MDSLIRCLAFSISLSLKIIEFRDFPGIPVIKTLNFQCRACRFDPFLGN